MEGMDMGATDFTLIKFCMSKLQDHGVGGHGGP